ncbi:polymerase [Mesorhizobium sp. C120A]|uniref:polymerase n=1 Tax=Mesorhizobium sp. C120A TaxID=2956824 RepID=UPI0025763633|nr:polymerase [Mesorhizobium sp. C120A]WJI47267.1 polymerase [Mesorhizobium sp. C120A]
MRDALLAFGVAMSYAAQLSIPGLPFGYSELCLTLWIMLSMTRILAGGQLEVTPALAKLGLFWLILALAMGVGYIIGFLTTTLFLDPLLHDTLAYVLLACVTCLAAAEPNASFRLRRIAWWMVAVANAGFIIQVGLGFGWLHQAGVEPWYWDRFCGWSDNPNQLALYCALLGPLALHLATTTSNKWGRCLALCSLIFTVYVGRLTKSDTYLYTTVLACLILLGLRVRAWLASDGNKASLSRQLAVLMAVGFLPLALSIAPYALSEASSAEDFAKSLTKDKGGEATAQTAALRLYLWNAALEKGHDRDRLDWVRARI